MKGINWKDRLPCEQMPRFYNKTYYGLCEQLPDVCKECILEYQRKKK